MSSLHNTLLDSEGKTGFTLREMLTIPSVAARLRQTQKALGLKSVELCAELEIGQNQWSQFVTTNPDKQRMIVIEVAVLLCDTYGLSLDWIYRGNPTALPTELRAKLRKVEAA